MENAKESGTGDKIADENHSPKTPTPADAEAEPAAGLAPPPPRPPARTPFTGLSQVDADLALARALQEQERAYMMLRMNGGEGSDYESSDGASDGNDDGDDPDHRIQEAGSAEGSDYGEDAFDANDRSIDSAEFESDEAFARALQDAEEREVAVRLMALAGLNDWGVENHGDHGNHSQDAWEEVDPDEYSYEELVALGEVVGTESRGLSAVTIASLPSVNYKAGSVQDGNTDQCVICRLEYEDGESIVVLSCKHAYHSECIYKWLQINKVCPICSTEVSTSGNKQE
ncbi:E3 ubiquitin ligase BIG BROTHER-related-like [Phoenix dactylifera]|uniref:E3 ubiquitin ligase BIG BROTHER-related-like n=1 Tax=Phoenix dactylifera TaxID=42345 RepID=A0A8B7CB32_PHODC|nr:E3 ubiquitin ligase BIG BROTHER-related-like [Phoenix dactylifera]